MSNFLSSLKSDLLDRRFLPVLVVLCVALVAAVGYAALGEGSHSTTAPAPTPSASATGPSSGAAGAVVITKAPETSTTKAAAETTSGAKRSSGAPRNPFKPLPSAKSASTGSSSSSSGQSAASSSSSSSSSSGSSSNSGSSTGGGTTPTVTVKPSAPAKPAPPKPIYVVSVLAGYAPSPGQPANLTAIPAVKTGEKLPSASDQRLVFQRVDAAGTAAIFKLLAPPILHGSATCIPSPEDCESIELPIKQAEQLEYAEENGQTALYEIEVIGISKVTIKAGAARAHTASRHHRRHHRHGH